MAIKPAALHEPEPRAMVVVRARQLLLPGVLVAAVVAGMSLLYAPPEVVVAAVAALLVGVIIISRPFAGLIVLMGVMVVQPGELEHALAALHVERVAAAMVIVAVAMELRHQRRPLVLWGHPLLTATYLFMLVLALSIPGAVWLGGAIGTFTGMLRTLAYCLLIINLIHNKRRLTILVRCFMALHTYVAFTTLRDYYTGKVVFAQGITRAIGQTSFGGDANNLAATLVAIIPFFFLGLRVERSWGWRLLWGLSLAGSVWTIVLTGSRSGFLALLVLSVLLWLMSPRKVVSMILAVTLLSATWVVMPKQYKTRYLTIKSQKLDDSSLGRIEAWKAGIRMFVERPLLGVGVGDFSLAHAQQAGEFQERNWLQPHSLYIQVLAEVGVLGTLAFFFFILRLFQYCARLIRRFPLKVRDSDYRGVVARGALIACLGLLVTGIFGHNLYRITWYLMGAFLVVVDRAREA
jgi:O-antigen ligase